VSKLLLVLGGTRSGKSRYALRRARDAAGEAVTFVATARAGDPELDRRIAAHQAERPAGWCTREVDRDMAGAIRAADASHLLLIDSLTLWASTIVEEEGGLRERWAEVGAALSHRARSVVLVSEEIGMGVIPNNELARRFVDELGWLNQRAAEACDEVRVMIAGLPVLLKSPP
jgi:adenosyl cobinamide kinase/adenosyl cobinamide phosphate guanylyltransferase